MSLGKGLINVGLPVCRTDSVYPFGPDNNFTSNIATYQLDGNANDTTGNYNGTATNVTFSSTGAYLGQAASFNGSSSKINTGYQIPSGLSGFSVSAWVKAALVKTQFIVGDLPSSGTATDGMFQINISSSNILRAAVGGTTSQDIATLSGYTNTWTHIVVTTDSSGNIIGYVNGSQVGTATGNSLIANTDDFVIGMYGNTTSHSTAFNGDIDQVRIFDREITASEVATLYAETSATASSINPLNEGQGVALYTLDYDASDAGGLYDGTPTDVTFGVGGQINYGARFNGSSSYIAVGSPIPNTDTNAAISAWVKLSSGISSTMNITGTGITSAGSEAPFRATLSYVSANTFKIFALRQVAGTYYYASTSSLTNVTINADTWYHVVLSYNSTGRKLSTFLNGTAIDTDVAMTTSGGSVNDSSTVIGSFRSTSGPFFDGDLDQIRFFTSALTSTQVSTLYAE
ncbi:MAG: LamG domain-containing protein, partial [Methylophilaceae bacterium]